MDLLRAAIKAMYYHYPIEDAFGMTAGEDSKGKFLTHFERLASEDAEGFSRRELTSYRDALLNDLKNHGFRVDNKIRLMAGLPLLFAEKVLTKDAEDYPRVEFKHLLRWREVVKCVGEDLFTTSFLAKNERKRRKDFLWPNVILHNDEKINTALDGGLSDIHTHFGGSIDTFHFNWICLMNDVEAVYDKFKLMTYSNNPAVAFEKDYSFRKMAAWCRVAAAIRMCLFKTLVKGDPLKPTEEKAAILSLGTDSETEAITQLKQRINELRADGKTTRDGVTLDYAITEDLVAGKNASSPYYIYAGERQITYQFYKAYLQPGSSINGTWIELFYLYELIKIHLRKEFVFANKQYGLENYNGFTSRSALFTKQIEPICNLSSVQTSIRRGKDDYVETRVTTGALGLTTGEYWKGLFSSEAFLDQEELKKRLTFVIQFTKSTKAKNVHKEGRYRSKREEVHEEYQAMTRWVSSKQSPYEIIGIDVGGTELSCRPEVFAHMLRSGKEQGFGITYHVGEEFYDLADGLRSIWEIIQYANIGKKDRLGHCVALGVAADDYYRRKHVTLSMPRQVLLDNMVWLCCFAKEKGISIQPELEQRLSDIAKELYEDIGYKSIGELNMTDYYQSMLLRSDDLNMENGQDVWSRTALLDTERASKARKNLQAQKLCMAYSKNDDIIARGEEAIQRKLGMAYAKLITAVQGKMIEMVNETGLCIESCPSSNLQICRLVRYDCHPAIKYYLRADVQGGGKLNIAVCTDDKGTFSTSLTNELSLLALAATKEDGWNGAIEKDFRRLIAQGKKYRFKTKTSTI